MNSNRVSVGAVQIDLCDLNTLSEPAGRLANNGKFSINQICADCLVAVWTSSSAKFFCDSLIFKNEINLDVVRNSIIVSNFDRALTTQTDIFEIEIYVYWAIIWKYCARCGLE